MINDFKNDVEATPSQRLAELLNAKGWSEKQLSERAGLGHGYVNSALKKTDWRPQSEKLQALADALDCDPAYLMGTTTQKRVVGAIKPGAAWDHAIAAPIAGHILTGIEDAVEAAGDLQIYHLTESHATALGVSLGSTVIVSNVEPYATGDLVMARDSDERLNIYYFAEPYLIKVGRAGTIRHEFRTDTFTLVGKIVLTVTVPDLKLA